MNAVQKLDRTSSDLQSTPLADLHEPCEAQLAAFRRSRDTQQDSSSCEEILRRAADGDDNAFALLWTISITFVRQYCPPQCRHMLDDIAQDVGLRLLHKFRHSTSPYRAGTFAAYRLYVRRTIQSVCINTHRSQHATMVSIESHSDLHSGSMDQGGKRVAAWFTPKTDGMRISSAGAVASLWIFHHYNLAI